MKKSCLTNPEIIARLESAGVSSTAQRIAICRYVLCEADHPTAEDVKKWADKNFPKVSMATVYNTLNTLVKAGLLREFRLPHMESLVYDDNIVRHFHFVDDKTGEIVDLDAEAVTVSHRLGRGFKIKHIELTVRGEKTN